MEVRVFQNTVHPRVYRIARRVEMPLASRCFCKLTGCDLQVVVLFGRVEFDVAPAGVDP